MKFSLITLLVLLSSCSSVNSKVDSQLQEALSYGEIVELNEYSEDIEKQLLLRLFRAPIREDDCFNETHGVCRYQYFISVATFDDHPETNIFPLSTTGEIRSYKWLDVTEIDTAKIEFEINNYTKAAIKNNPKLISKTDILNIIVTPEKILESLND